MKSPRELMRDPRMAAAVAVVAILFVGYRVYQQPSPPDVAQVIDRNPAPGALAARGSAGALASPSADGLVLARDSDGRLVDEVAWSWERNPFLDAGKKEHPRSLRSSGLPGSPSDNRPAESGGSDSRMGFRGTVVSGSKSMAIFGSRIVPEGETVGDWTVEKIEPYRVVVRHGSQSRTLETCGPLAQSHDLKKGEMP